MILIGSEHSKRSDYFIKAAVEQGVEVHLLTWAELPEIDIERKLEGAVVKIDPPSFRTVDLQTMREQLKQYREMLRRLQKCSCRFLNSPGAILAVLDKRLAKRKLQKGLAGLDAITEMLAEQITSVEDFFDCLHARHCYQVFIKPVHFSGAAGVTAFRMQPSSGRMKLYSSAVLKNGILHNTRKLFCLEDRQEILEFLNALFQMDVLVERWYPKDSLNGQSYDLRVVCQFGHTAYIVVRRAGKGPITNLHLNNQAETIDCLGWSQKQFAETEELCSKACSVFSGLQVAGVDVMLDRGSRKPRIIEMNGQGDLIYQDIYDRNGIYREQVIRMQAI